MRESHATGRNDHQDAKNTFNGNKVLFLLGLWIGFDSTDKQCTQHRNTNRYRYRKNVTVTKADRQTNVFESFENRDQGNRECRQENIDRHISLGFRKRVLLAEDQLLDTTVNKVRNKTSGKRGHHPAHDDGANFAPLHSLNTNADSGKTDDGTDDRVRRRNRPTIPGCN